MTGTLCLELSNKLMYLEIMKSHRKELVVSKDRMLVLYPSLYETREKGMLRRIIKKLVLMRKGD
jgi:hypothetical protein